MHVALEQRLLREHHILRRIVGHKVGLRVMLLPVLVRSQIVRVTVAGLERLRLRSLRVERVRLHRQLDRFAGQLRLDGRLDHKVWRRLLAVHLCVRVEELILGRKSVLMLLDVAQYVRLLDGR